MRTALVFGGSGFIGTRLIGKLVGMSEYQRVISLDLSRPANPVAGAEYNYCDVREPIQLEGDFGKVEIFHLAAIHVTPGHDDYEYFWTNVLGALNVCEFASQKNCRLVVFTSSIAVYGASEERLTEASKLSPDSAYGMSKVQAERIHRLWRRSNPDNRLMIIRCAAVYGPGERGNFTRLARLLKRGSFIYSGRRDTVKACCYVDELVRAIFFVRSLGKPDVTFNFVYPEPYTIEDICRVMADVGGYAKPKLTLPMPLMLLAAQIFEIAAKAGLKTPINRDRVMKLVRSTNIACKALTEMGYKFETDLKQSFVRWRDEAPAGEFV